jgi:hypothetical protein
MTGGVEFDMYVLFCLVGKAVALLPTLKAKPRWFKR